MDPTQRLANTASDDDPGEICGVDRELIRDFLILIRDNYRLSDQASAFLEHRAGVSNVHAFTNVRDVLSHLCSMLDKNTPKEKKRDQLNNAEEHLRRSILEPYEVGFGKLTADFIEVYESYKENVIPVAGRYSELQDAPDISIVDGQLREIHNLAAKGRSAKGRNLWTPEWESGVASFLDAFDRLSILKAELEGFSYKYRHIKHDESVSSGLEQLSHNYEAATNRIAELEAELAILKSESADTLHKHPHK